MNSASSLLKLKDFRKVLRLIFFNLTSYLIRGAQFLSGILSSNIWAGCREGCIHGFFQLHFPSGVTVWSQTALAHLLPNSVFISCVVLEVSVSIIQVSGEVSTCS